MNTLCTTWHDQTPTPPTSKSKDSLDPADGVAGFTQSPTLVCTDYNESKTGVPEQTYVILNSNLVGLELNGTISMTLSEFNETADQELFKNEKVLEIKPFLFLPYGNASNRVSEDMQLYVAFSRETTESPIEETPQLNSAEFMYIQPIKGGGQDTLKISAKYKSVPFGEFKLSSLSDKKDGDRTEYKFKEYINNSPVAYSGKYPASRGTSSTEIPFYVRCAIKTDYRIRGQAEIAGYSSAKHRTLYIDDKQTGDIALQYNDHTYDGDGGWDVTSDGYLDGTGTAEQSLLANLQSIAEATLSKYTNVGNSGYTELNGCQWIKPGDMIDEFEETSGTTGDRGYDFEAIITKVGLDLIERKSIISYGANFG